MRRFALIPALLLCLVLAAGAAFAKDTPVKVFVNGTQKQLSPAAFERNGKVYLPLAATARAVKATVKEDKAKKTFTVTADKKKTTIKESEGVRVKGQFMAPMDAISKALDCTAKYDKSAKTVKLSSKPKESPKHQPAAPTSGG